MFTLKSAFSIFERLDLILGSSAFSSYFNCRAIPPVNYCPKLSPLNNKEMQAMTISTDEVIKPKLLYRTNGMFIKF